METYRIKSFWEGIKLHASVLFWHIISCLQVCSLSTIAIRFGHVKKILSSLSLREHLLTKTCHDNQVTRNKGALAHDTKPQTGPKLCKMCSKPRDGDQNQSIILPGQRDFFQCGMAGCCTDLRSLMVLDNGHWATHPIIFIKIAIS